MIFRLTATLLALLLLLPTSLLAAPVRPAPKDTGISSSPRGRVSGRQYHPRRVIVTYKKKASKADRKRARAAVKSESLRVIKPRRAGKSAAPESEVLMLTGDVSVETAVARLRGHAAVATAEPDRVYRALFTPNDPNFSPKQWHLQNTGQSIMGTPGTPGADINAPQAWDRLPSGGTTPAIVAIIDSGIDLTHPDLTANIWTNPGETPGNGIDDDSNGYVDDVQGHNWGSLAQWEFGSGNTSLGFSPTANSEIAQSFRGNGGRIAGIWVNIWRVGTPAQNVTVSIRSSRSGADLDSFTLEPGTGVHKINDNTESYWDRWSLGSFSSPLPMTDGQTYYLVLSTTNNSASTYYAINDSNNIDGFADGNMSVKSGSWTDFSSDDTAFELVVDSANGYGGRPRDDMGHGTHVSGIAAAATNNGIGVAGVSGRPSGAAAIMPLRALDSQGFGYDSDITSAIYYAADNGADVINMSLGGTGSSSLMQAAVNYAVTQGVTILAASGNNYDNPAILYPAGYANVIGVGATTNQDGRASFSTRNSSVDVSAPGQYIYSTEPTYPNYFSQVSGDSLSYEWMSGTSMATPVAAGVAALLARARPGWTPAEIEQRLRDTAVDLGPPGRDDEFGSGRLDALAAVNFGLFTTLSSTPSSPNGLNGWYTTAPTITLTPDEPATAFFGWDTTSSVTTYTAPFSAPAGAHDLYYWSVDASLNVEPVNNLEFKLDTSKPTDPIISGSTPTASSWTNDNTIEAAWPAVNSPGGATDTISGIDAFSVSWSQNTTETPDPIEDLDGIAVLATSPLLADGDWWFNLRTKDNAGLWTSTVHFGPFNIDTVAPTNPSAPATETAGVADDTWQNSFSDPSFTWEPGTDADSGVGGYNTYWGTDPGGTPSAFTTTAAYDPGAVLSPATYYLRVTTLDNAGNESSPITLFTFKYETVAPTNPEVPATETAGAKHDLWQNSISDPDFTWSAGTDADSGIGGYFVYWGPSTTGTSTTYTPSAAFDPPAVSNGSENHLRIKTRDNAGNDAGWKTLFTFKYDTTRPTNPTTVTESGGANNDSWQNALSDPSFTWSGASAGAGSIDGYSVYWGPDSSGTTVTTYTASEAFNPPPVGDPTVYYLRTMAKNSVGNESDWETIFIFRYDGTDPTSPIAPALELGGVINNIWQNSVSNPSFTWGAASDANSGVRGYNIYWGTDSGGAPNTWTTLTSFNPITVGSGIYYLRIKTKDSAGNETEATSLFTFKYDNHAPSGLVKIRNGAAYTRSLSVPLNLTAGDTASGLDKVRYRNSSGSWGAWESFASSKMWTLSAGDGTKEVYYGLRDKTGNEKIVSDTIVLDTKKPTTRMETPFVSTKTSKTTTFKVKWWATEPSPSSGIEYVNVYYRPSTSSKWRRWRTGTALSGEGYFTGKAGTTYYFRTLVVDNAHNYDWSKTYRTILPFNEGIYTARTGFNGYAKSGSSQNYLTSVRFGYGRGHTLRYKLYNTDSIGLVVTKGPNMGRAEIYVDGKYVTTVDAHASQTKARQLIFYKGFTKKSTHYLKVVNLGTPGRARFEVDGLVVGR